MKYFYRVKSSFIVETNCLVIVLIKVVPVPLIPIIRLCNIVLQPK